MNAAGGRSVYDRPMKPIVSILLTLAMLSALGGCIIRTRGNARARSCPPAHHWDGYACVHNGHGHGNGNVRDHRR